MSIIQETLRALGLEALNAGTWSGAGGWSADPQAPLIESVNPASGAPLARIQASSPADYERVLGSAVEAAKAWRRVPAPKRGEAIRALAAELREHKQALGALVSLENGKIRAEGEGEVQEMIDIADFAVGQSRMLYGLTMHSERPQHRMYEQWHPLGVVGVITAFNFPVAVWSWNACLAAIAGNATVWKPSPKTALCALAVQRLCARVMAEQNLPPIFQLFVDRGTELAMRLVEDRRVALLSFTGSTAVGRQVAVKVAERLGKCLLELGGNNAIIVDEHANLALAVPAIVFGAVGTAGQRCTTTRRVLVHRSRLAELGQRLVAAYRQVRIGDPLQPGTLMGPLIDAAAVRRYHAAIEAAKSAGAAVLCGARDVRPAGAASGSAGTGTAGAAGTSGGAAAGGAAGGAAGYFVEPTIIEARAGMAVVQEETFAPILYLIPYDSLEEAIAQQNSVPYGLSSSLFTDRLQAAERFLSAEGSDCGIANINLGTSGAEIGGAFGGEKDTGGGREAGSDAWKAYMRRQTCTINWSSELPLAQGIKFDL